MKLEYDEKLSYAVVDNGKYIFYWVDGPHKNAKALHYHEPLGEGDKHYVTVEFEDGSFKRYFNVIEIDFL